MTNELRHIDYDGLRESARALRREAISEMLNAAVAWLASLPARIDGRAQLQARGSAPCTSVC